MTQFDMTIDPKFTLAIDVAKIKNPKGIKLSYSQYDNNYNTPHYCSCYVSSYNGFGNNHQIDGVNEPKIYFDNQIWQNKLNDWKDRNNLRGDEKVPMIQLCSEFHYPLFLKMWMSEKRNILLEKQIELLKTVELALKHLVYKEDRKEINREIEVLVSNINLNKSTDLISSSIPSSFMK